MEYLWAIWEGFSEEMIFKQRPKCVEDGRVTLQRWNVPSKTLCGWYEGSKGEEKETWPGRF